MTHLKPEIIKCRKCDTDKPRTEYYVCSGTLKRWCKDCLKKDQTERAKRYIKNGVTPVKRKYKKKERKKVSVVGWNGDDEIYF